MMEIQHWLIEWFENNTDLNREFIQDKTQTSFLLEKWIDSLKFVLLITELEDHFKIKFSGNEFHSESFSTISGLIPIIQNKINENN